MIFKEQFKMQLKDVGKNNCIKNIGILEIFENIATHHSDTVGLGPNDVETVGASWILLDWKLQVIKRLKYGENLNVSTWARTIDGKIKKTYTYRDFEVYDDQKNLCIIGTSKWALINVTTGRITKIENDMINKYNFEDKNVFNEPELEKIEVPENYERESEYKVTRRDIDINGHMHNLYYLYLAYDALPEDIYEQRPFNNVRIQYKREVKINDIVKCRYTRKNKEHIVSIVDKNDEKVHAIIILK